MAGPEFDWCDLAAVLVRPRALTPKHVRANEAQLRDAVSKVDCPTLVVRGGRSTVFFDEDAAELAAASGDGLIALVAAAGHTVQGDNPRGLLEVMEPFLADVLG